MSCVVIITRKLKLWTGDPELYDATKDGPPKRWPNDLMLVADLFGSLSVDRMCDISIPSFLVSVRSWYCYWRPNRRCIVTQAPTVVVADNHSSLTIAERMFGNDESWDAVRTFCEKLSQ
ncbi:hypothetical protein EVAR_80005_1 [Eumeta japonica]|uniref:Uncharacterized protein n=1 Tax=Eumeta variegata TaxID=151549 RepID=A0A4C1WKX7_EUMVA|nr:hypothetical protein EVAR_80005_1 [Eumeta japonica]